MKKLGGCITALVTPFHAGKVDFTSLEKVMSFQLERGVTGFVVNGTTAESPTLTESEQEELLKFVLKYTGGKIPVIMGTGSNSTQKTIQATQKAEALGAHAALVVVPYYNKPPQRGLYEHFKVVADSVKMPIIMYNVPARTVTSLETATIRKLSEIKNIAAIKEATGNIGLAKEIRSECRNDFLLLSGDDGTYFDFLRAGGDGIISVASHVIPQEMSTWNEDQHKKYINLINLLFTEANPIPVKMALYLMGFITSPELRLPLVVHDTAKTEVLKKEMQKLGIM